MHQVVDLRADHGPTCRALASREQQAAYMERRAAAQRSMRTRYAVTLDGSFTLPDGRVLGSLEPIDLAELHAADARAALADGRVIESLTWPAEPRQPWE